MIRAASAAALAAVVLAAASAPARAAAPARIGVQTHSLHSEVSVADFDRELDLARAAGFSTVRVDLGWSTLERDGPGDFSSEYARKVDTFLGHARKRRIGVIATLLGTPCWASSAPEDVKQNCEGEPDDRQVNAYPPTDSASLLGVSEFVGRRWGRSLAALEIWNEPNEATQRFLRSPDPAAAYASMLRVAYPAVKRTAPRLPVLGGSIAGSDTEFLERLYSYGIQGNFDGLSFHSYNGRRDPTVPGDPNYIRYDFLTGPPTLRAVLDAHGDARKGMWLTETGFSTCTGETDCVSRAIQGRYLTATVGVARRFGFLRVAIIYELRDSGPDPRSREDRYGILSRRFAPKPAYRALAKALAR